MTKPTFRRACAYFLDLLIVLVISSLFAKIEILTPNMDKYEETYNKYTEVVSNLSSGELNNEEVTNISYDLSKYGMSVSIINLVVTFLYFGIFQYFNEGQTIGKKLMRIKIVSLNGNKLKLWQTIVRTLIINSVLISAIQICILGLCSKSLYLSSSQYLQMIDMTIIFVSIIMILFRLDGRGIHDFITSTKVVYEYEITDEVKEAKIVKNTNKKEVE